MRKLDGVFKSDVVKVFRFCARAEKRHTEIYRIGARKHACAQAVRATRRGYDLHQRSFAPNFVAALSITEFIIFLISASEKVFTVGCKRIENATLLYPSSICAPS